MPGLTDVVAISTSCAIKADGTAWCWGVNYHGEAGDGTFGNYYDAPVQVAAW